MARIWDLINKDTQDKLVVLMFELLLKEKPYQEPEWTPPDMVKREFKGWQVIGKIENQEEIDQLMREPTMKRMEQE